MFRICAEFHLDKRGSRSLRYAYNLARALEVELVIRMPQGEEDPALLLEGFLARHGLDLRDARRVRYDDVQTTLLPSDGRVELIYVSNLSLEEAQRRAPEGAHVLLSQAEGDSGRAILRHICLPLGDRDASLRAAEIAFPLATAVSGQVHAVHTTFSDPRVRDQCPELHMNDEARRVQGLVRDRAATSGVQIDFNVTMADEITNFVIGAAADRGCQLIVVSPGIALQGSSAYRVTQRSHIPVLIINPARRV